MYAPPIIARHRPESRSGYRRRVLVVASCLALGLLGSTGCGSGSSGSASSATSTTSSGQTSTTSATALLTTGIAQADAKQYAQAATTFRDVLVVSPGNKFAWYNLGLVEQLQKQSATAIADYSKAIASDPGYTPAMYNKAILLEATDPQEALALYQQITKINPKAATAYLRESFVYSRLGNKAKAAEARDRAVALDKKLATVTAPAQPK
jgi:tetratricopeptide (TPR) repeat protein